MAVDPVSGRTPQVAGVIRQAAQSTGVSFEYLLTTARIESNLNPSAQASTSSAKGLYQFIEQTWLGTMKQDGPALGLGQYSDAITRNADGRYEVPDPATRAAIMRLRSDPKASAMLAGAFTRANAMQVENAIGRAPSDGELYIAHFLGPDGAGRLINAAASRPQASAAAMFPQAAAANQSIFYERSGSPRSVAAVYAKLAGKFEVARAASFGMQVAEAAPRPPAAVPTPTPTLTPAPAAMLAQTQPPTPAAQPAPAPVPDTAGLTQAYAEANASLPPAVDNRPLFQAMFTDRAGAAVAARIGSLWSSGGQDQAPVRALDLFSDSRGDIRKLFGNG
ncbi:MAG: transglycosylase SLT domain-containing protein [Pseudolabrys sp.]